MIKCQRCDSERVLCINAKPSDRASFSVGSIETSGYAPDVSDICNDDYTFPRICLDCGQTQGGFPKPIIHKLEGPWCTCSKEDRGRPADDGDGPYCTYCGENVSPNEVDEEEDEGW